MNVVDKIQALKRLSENKSATPSEAANAAARVQELMLKHKITEAELGSDESKEEIHWFKDDPLHVSKRDSAWRVVLACGIAEVNGCRCMTGVRPDGARRISLLGRASDVEVVRYLYAYLEREIERLAKGHLLVESKNKTYDSLFVTGLHRGKSFRMGAVFTVLERLKAQKIEVETVARAEGMSTALSIIDKRDEDLKVWISKNATSKRQVGNDPVHVDSFNAGRKAATSIALNDALESGAARAIR